MYLIKVGLLDTNDPIALTEKGKSQDFEKAKQKADKLLKSDVFSFLCSYFFSGK